MNALRRARPYWPTWLVGALVLAVLLALATGCGPSGDPRNPNPGDFQAALPCQPNPVADKSVAVEVIDREARLVNASGVLVRRDAISIVGIYGQGGYAIDLPPDVGKLPDERAVTAPWCWDLFLRPEVDEAIVTLEVTYPLVPGERLVCYEFMIGLDMPNLQRYKEVPASSVSMIGTCRLEIFVQKRAR